MTAWTSNLDGSMGLIKINIGQSMDFPTPYSWTSQSIGAFDSMRTYLIGYIKEQFLLLSVFYP